MGRNSEPGEKKLRDGCAAGHAGPENHWLWFVVNEVRYLKKVAESISF